VSGIFACVKTNQLSQEKFEIMDALAYKLENGLIKLVERLEEKQQDGSWIDPMIINESKEVYFMNSSHATPALQDSKTPQLHHSRKALS